MGMMIRAGLAVLKKPLSQKLHVDNVLKLWDMRLGNGFERA